MFGRRKRKDSSPNLQRMTDGGGEPLLLGEKAHAPLHPKIWMILGVIYVALGITQVVLASLWRWWWGVAAGFSITKLGTTLIGMGMTGGRQPPLPGGASLTMHLRHIGTSIVYWGSGKLQRLIFWLRWVIYAYGIFVALIVYIHLSSPDPPMTAFPTSCGANRYGCSRVAEISPQASRGLHPLIIAAPLNVTQAAVENWITSQTAAHFLGTSRPGFVHARFVTLMFGFADDFMVGIRCKEEDGKSVAVVEVQGQLRIGKSDLGVNSRRNQRFLEYMKGLELPEGACAS